MSLCKPHGDSSWESSASSASTGDPSPRSSDSVAGCGSAESGSSLTVSSCNVAAHVAQEIQHVLSRSMRGGRGFQKFEERCQAHKHSRCCCFDVNWLALPARYIKVRLCNRNGTSHGLSQGSVVDHAEHDPGSHCSFVDQPEREVCYVGIMEVVTSSVVFTHFSSLEQAKTWSEQQGCTRSRMIFDVSQIGEGPIEILAAGMAPPRGTLRNAMKKMMHIAVGYIGLGHASDSD
eukprot:TRINITY_DN95815_c0_g1_i1.p1 TRINITY_DN95815_c0_g1~~TRINITY_DN95815_c0_g1_i1.p1  ORF type:complete len:233 (+),score=33.43 TRINITY_DN95815_c0_g1_i1:31-729(+)